MTTHTIVQRADLFYGRWQHKLKGFQPEFSCLRRMEHGYIDKIIHARRSWGQTMRQRQPGSWHWGALNIDDNTVQNLHSMCDFLLSNTVERKMVIAQSWFYIYSDDLDFLQTVSQLGWLDPKKIEISSVKLIASPGLLVRKNSCYQKRSYFRAQELSEQQKNTLKNFLISYADIRIGPALLQCFDQSHRHRMLDYYFVDHNDDNLPIMLALINPGLLRKTVPIIQYK